MAPMRARLVIVVIAFVGCNEVLGLDKRPTRATPGGGGDVGCDVCLTAAPDGWDGPVAVRPGASTCEDETASTTEATLFQDVSAQGDCVCACGDATGIVCDALTLRGYADAACMNELGTFPAVNGVCAKHEDVDFGSYDPPTANTDLASCEPIESAGLAAPSWARTWVGCGPLPTVDCGDASCLSAPEGAVMCIYREGDVPCPGAPFTDREQWHADYDDARVCAPCACGAVDAACNEVVTSYADDDCTAMPTPALPTPMCGVVAGARIESSMFVATPSGSCVASGGEVSGEVTPTVPTTVCCVPR